MNRRSFAKRIGSGIIGFLAAFNAPFPLPRNKMLELGATAVLQHHYDDHNGEINMFVVGRGFIKQYVDEQFPVSLHGETFEIYPGGTWEAKFRGIPVIATKRGWRTQAVLPTDGRPAPNQARRLGFTPYVHPAIRKSTRLARKV